MLRTPDSTDTSTDVAAPADDRETGPADGGRPAPILAQRGLFFGPSGKAPEDLYSVVEMGTARRRRHRIDLSPGSRVHTNTYFGRFHATYWQRWTPVTEVEVEAVVTGSGRVRLMASDTNKVWRVAAVADVEDVVEQKVRFVAPIDRFLDGGGMWLELTTEIDGMSVSDVRWSVVAVRPVPRTDLVICTYNRVDDCLNTLQSLADDPGALALVGTVEVVDQGSDPLESRERFLDVAAALGEHLRYVRQPNLGGAGGFTRGLFDATAGAPEEQSDILLMDDDVMLEPEIVVRLTSFAASTATPMIIGGQMLNLLHPGHLHVSAERADPEKLVNGLEIAGALREAYLLGLDERNLPINQERRVDAEYNGWWSCLIPAAIVREIGYPLPVFFQWDDVEYGYRARAHGFPTVTLPGAGVWHADFGWKDWDEWHRYFNLRNALIMAALHTDFSTKRVITRVGHLLSTYLIAMHYGLTATLLQAVEDFLDGPEILDDGSVAAAAEIRRIRAAYPETIVHPMSEMSDDFRDLQIVRAANEPGNLWLTFAKRAAYHVLGRAPHGTGTVAAGDAHWWHVSLFDRAVVTDMGETGVRIRQRDPERVKALAKRGLVAMRRLRSEGPAVAQRYRDDMGRLTSRANWARLYGVDE
ncbi:MAG: galactofuranosylgalactofuranosylrhamnosyl-N-acetylglucosaminyl-diphospho-decaprenol [Pseudonocardiales bacterium]|nr:galactofuranosylgalactofuranosylrhamnosyl-N-acetylglucosaminyl-diphospho-decaprenol [Pseudonocardiales bacterium]